MASVNKVILVGNAGRDPETRVVGENSVTTLALATSEKYKDKNGQAKEVTTWHEIVFWNKLGGIVAQYVKKGSSIYVEGSIKVEKYQKDGQDVYRTKIVASSMQLLGGGSGGSNGGNAAAAPANPAPPQPAASTPSYGGGYDDSDIPF